MVAQTRAAGSDTDGQERAVGRSARRLRQPRAQRPAQAAVAAGTAVRTPAGAIGRRTASSAAATLEMSGPGVFSVAARATIKHQVLRLSILSTCSSCCCCFVYRSALALVLGLIPVASGALAGIAAVALGFGAVHGITLGFGVTLIGESVDYSIYLFIQSQRSSRQAATARTSEATRATRNGSDPLAHHSPGRADVHRWLRLPAAFRLSRPGTARTVLHRGTVAAALVTRFVLPNLLPARLHISDLVPLGAGICCGAAATARAARLTARAATARGRRSVHARGSVWNRELSALSPVSAPIRLSMHKLRSDIGAPDVSALVVISGPDQEAVLQAAEAVGARLDHSGGCRRHRRLLDPARYLPSLAAQRARQQACRRPMSSSARSRARSTACRSGPSASRRSCTMSRRRAIKPC